MLGDDIDLRIAVALFLIREGTSISALDLLLQIQDQLPSGSCDVSLVAAVKHLADLHAISGLVCPIVYRLRIDRLYVCL